MAEALRRWRQGPEYKPVETNSKVSKVLTDAELRSLYDAGLSTVKLARRLDCGGVTILTHLRRVGTKMRPRGWGLRGARNHAWRGGRYFDKHTGYWRVSVDGQSVWEHRFVMEKHLGRKLATHEQVHHLNGIRHDNRVENLAVIERSKHKPYTLYWLQAAAIKKLEARLALQETVRHQGRGEHNNE